MEKSTPKGVRAHHDDTLGLDYLVGSSVVLFENGVKLPVLEYESAKATGAQRALFDRALSDSELCNYDYRYAKTTGHLRKKKTAGTEAVRVKETNKAVVDQVPIHAQEPVTDQKENATIAIVIAVMLAIGTGSVVMSAYHGWQFLAMIGKPLWVAVLTGVMFVVFSSTAFTASRYFYERKKRSTGKGANTTSTLFVLFGVVIVLYSIMATLSVNYDQYQKSSTGASSSVIEAQKTAVSSKAESDRLQQRYNDKVSDITDLEKRAEYWKTQNWAKYENALAEIKTARSERDALSEKLTSTSVAQAVSEKTEEIAEGKRSVYEFIESLFKFLPSAGIEFFMFAVPSVFYDVIAPFSLFVVLLLVDIEAAKKSKSKEDTYGKTEGIDADGN